MPRNFALTDQLRPAREPDGADQSVPNESTEWTIHFLGATLGFVLGVQCVLRDGPPDMALTRVPRGFWARAGSGVEPL